MCYENRTTSKATGGAPQEYNMPLLFHCNLPPEATTGIAGESTNRTIPAYNAAIQSILFPEGATNNRSPVSAGICGRERRRLDFPPLSQSSSAAQQSSRLLFGQRDQFLIEGSPEPVPLEAEIFQAEAGFRQRDVMNGLCPQSESQTSQR
jgi:hypothetical protein